MKILKTTAKQEGIIVLKVKALGTPKNKPKHHNQSPLQLPALLADNVTMNLGV